MLIKRISRLVCTGYNNYFDKVLSFTKLTNYCNTGCKCSALVCGDILLGGKQSRFLHRNVNFNHYRQDLSSAFDNNMKGDDKKVKLRAVRLREQRKKTGHNNRTPPVSLQILGSGTKHSPPSVMIIAGNNRLLFNCGEGMQRLLLENGIKSLSRFEHFLFTRLAWDNVGGAIGMSLTLKNMGLPTAYFHGPPNLEEFVQAYDLFTRNETINIVTRPYTEGTIETEAMVITPVPLFAAGSQDGNAEDTCYSSGSSSVSDSSDDDTNVPSSVEGKRKGRFHKSHGSKRRKVQTANLSLAYVCKLHPKTGPLLIEKCKEMGLRPFGPHLGILKHGESFTTEDGRVIKPEDVTGPEEPAAYFIILECPSEEYVNAVITSQALSSHHEDAGNDAAKIVVHMCPETVIENPIYKQWMNKFGAATEHVVLNRSCDSITHNAVHRLQTKLNHVHDEIFPKLPMRRTPDAYASDGALRITRAESNMMFGIRPANGWNRQFMLSSDITPFLQEIKDLPPEFNDSLNELKKDLETMASCHGNSKYPELMFTGTGSAVPNKDRNVTGILLNVSETQSIMIDCGEGTYGQLRRFYGKDGIDDMIAKLQCVFVSHIHADHHSGFINILQEWEKIVVERREGSRELIVVGPKHMKRWLLKYHHHCEPIMHKVRFIDLRSLSIVAPGTNEVDQTALLKSLDLAKFKTVPVIHCYHSYGLVLTHKTGWKVAYSGDCLPSDDLVQAGQNADLLIHEATLEDGMNEEAMEKRHSMISEAINIGARMNAKFTLLTHFSQRYMKVPYFKSEVHGQVGIAFDNMRVSLSDLPILPKFLPVLRHLFADKITQMEKSRQLKKDKSKLMQEFMAQDEKKRKTGTENVYGEKSKEDNNETDNSVQDKAIR